MRALDYTWMGQGGQGLFRSNRGVWISATYHDNSGTHQTSPFRVPTNEGTWLLVNESGRITIQSQTTVPGKMVPFMERSFHAQLRRYFDAKTLMAISISQKMQDVTLTATNTNSFQPKFCRTPTLKSAFH